jgi:RNA polymerase sigma factor (sigma-70 family)
MKSTRHHDDIEAWLNNAGRARLLDKDEVIKLSRSIQAAPADSDQRKRLVAKLVSHNMRLAVNFVQRFFNNSRKEWGCQDTVDYLQQAMIGLTRAAEKYDPSRGYQFSTYAAHWMYCAISRYNMKNQTLVYVPESRARQVMYYKRNGVFKKKSGGLESPERAESITREIELAHLCSSLDMPIGDGAPDSNAESHTLASIVAAPESPSDPAEMRGLAEQALREAGVCEQGIQVVVGIFADGKNGIQVSEETGIPYHRVKQLKKESIEKARKRPQSFDSLRLALS